MLPGYPAWGAAMLPGYPARLDSLATKGLAAYLIKLRSDTPQQGACVRRVVHTEHLQTYCRGEAEAAAIALRRRPERRRSQAAESSGSPWGQVCTKMASTYRSGSPSNRRASQTFTVPLALTETSCWPSGLNATGYRRRSPGRF